MKIISSRLPEHDYRVVYSLIKEFSLSISDFVRKAILHEIRRMRSLSREEKMEEIIDNVEWNRTKHTIFNK